MKKDKNGNFKMISWDDAFSFIAEKLLEIKEKYGPEAVGYLWHLDSNEMFSQQLFTQLYGTPNWSGHGAACDQSRRLAGLMTYGHPLPTKDYENSRFIMLWGEDPLGPNQSLHENRELVEVLKKGAKLVVVDPYRSRTAEKAHVWLPINPGTDGALALAMTHRIIETGAYDADFCENYIYGFEAYAEHIKSNGYTPQWAEPITGIDAKTIIDLADEFARTKPAVADGLKGIVNYTNGFQALRAIFSLNAITGNVDGPGCLILKEAGPLAPPLVIPEEAVAVPQRPIISAEMGYPLAPDIPSQLFPKAVLEEDPYPLKALFFHIVNPAMADPNTALFKKMMAALELSVTIDVYLSETAQLSDIVLPEASMFERAEVRESLWSGPQVIMSQPAIPCLGSSKPLYDIMRGLGEKMGYGKYFQWESWEDWAKVATAYLPVTFEELKEKGVWHGELRYHKYLEDGFMTSTGRVEVYSETLSEFGYDPMPAYDDGNRVKPDADYPFQLINGKMQYHCGTHTQNNPYLMAIEGENWAELNPLDAQKLGIADGDTIELASPIDKVKIAVRLKEGLKPGIVRVVHGHGFGRTMGSVARGKGTHVNPIFDSVVNDISGGIGYNECKVSIRKA
ncbi:molybdopterin-dependent oxidoreductase [Desulfosarcina cetonica]|uniref:molybdopterin-containing oxidoreductase family protein n=1 Tax=Desulfosarcina cetonica TaxID=90730 RepID=UPI0006D1E713|nr:molybdopterin-dependent oxidoreductase [Desulfosarcina cetonica]